MIVVKNRLKAVEQLFVGSFTSSGSLLIFHLLYVNTYLQWFPEEVVLAEDGDKEAYKAFNCHSNESLSHNVPLKWRFHFVKLT